MAPISTIGATRVKFTGIALCTFLFIFGFGFSARAQNTETGSIAGTVQDNSAAVIPGATVTVRNAAGVTQTGTSDEKGEFLVGGLPPGTYTVHVAAAGFKDFKAASIEVTAGQIARVIAEMAPAGVSTSVNVQSQAATQIETETSQIAGTLTNQEIVTIGLNGRNFTQLIALAPGVSNQTGQDEALVGVRGSVKYSVNGGRVEYNTFDVDGGDVLNASINGSSSSLIVFPSLDAISELQVFSRAIISSTIGIISTKPSTPPPTRSTAPAEPSAARCTSPAITTNRRTRRFSSSQKSIAMTRSHSNSTRAFRPWRNEIA